MVAFNPSRILVVLLGASHFPKAPKLASGRAFHDSAADLRDYLTDTQGLGVPEQNVQWLIDDSRAAADQLDDITSFLVNRGKELEKEGSPVQDLLLYYVGHGLFARGGQTYCLAVRSTNENNEGASSIRAADLASVLRDSATFLRRYLILDCCFSGVFYKELQSGPLQTARKKLQEELPARGTTLLCSSSARDASLAPQKLGRTMFSDALLRVLREGHPSFGDRLSISELGDAVDARLRNEYPDPVRPEVHSPDQREGDIAHIPIFPNPAFKGSAVHAQRVQEARIRDKQRESRETEPKTATAESIDAVVAREVSSSPSEKRQITSGHAQEQPVRLPTTQSSRRDSVQWAKWVLAAASVIGVAGMTWYFAGTIWYFLTGPPASQSQHVDGKAGGKSAPSAIRQGADPLRDLKLLSSDFRQTGITADWLVTIENKSASYSYTNIQYETTYSGDPNEMPLVNRGTIAETILPGEQKSWLIHDGNYPAGAVRQQIAITGATASSP